MQVLKTGSRESELALWQAKQVQDLLKQHSVESEIVCITSTGDADLITPLYQMGVQGIFTKTLDIALLNKRIDIAVHSMKDVPTHLPHGIRQAAVLPRGSYKDLLVLRNGLSTAAEPLGVVNGQWLTPPAAAFLPIPAGNFTIATGSIRRRAQWLHRFPHHAFQNLRGNVNTRLKKLADSNWDGAIFAAAGLERINLRPQNSLELDWMLPAPAQGAIMVVCREDDENTYNICQSFNDRQTALCTNIERAFLTALMGGCSTPISALAQVSEGKIVLMGNVCSADGRQMIGIEKEVSIKEAADIGQNAAAEMLENPAVQVILKEIQDAKR